MGQPAPLHPLLLLTSLLVLSLHGGNCHPKVPRCVVMSPNMVTVGVPFTAYVIVYNANDITVTLNVTDTETGLLMTQESGIATQDEITNVTLTLMEPPHQHDVDQYYVTLKVATSSPDIVLPSQAQILVTFKHGHVFTQLSQVTYHPGDTVHGHLFSTDEHLQLLLRPEMRVELRDPTGLAVVWADRKSEHKINERSVSEGRAYTFKLKLPEHATKGRWQARVLYGYEQRAHDDVYFQVSSSNIPTVVIVVNTEPRTILPTTKDITVTMSISFPVAGDTKINGTARVEVLGLTKEGTMVAIGSSDSGDTQLTFDGTFPPESITLDYGDFQFEDFRHLVVKSHIMDHVSGLMQTTNRITGVFATSPYVINLSQSAPTYKPGLTYSLQGAVEDPSGVPVAGLQVEVEVDGHRTHRVTDRQGLFLHYKDVKENRTSSLWFHVRVTAHNDHKLPETEQASVSHIVSRSESKGPGPKPLITVRKEAGYNFIVHYINRQAGSDYAQLHYVATSKGNVQLQGKAPITENNQQHFKLNMADVNQKMAPAFHLTAFYVRHDGDVIADGIWVEVQAGPCQNKIKLQDLPTEALRPLSRLAMTIRGEAGSFVSTSLLEKRQFEGTNSGLQLTTRTLSEIMSEGECRQDGGETTADVFYHAGLALLTTSHMTLLTRPNTGCVLPVPTRSNRHRWRRSTDRIPETFLEDWGISIQMKSVKLNSKGEYRQEAFLSALEGVWTVQAMGLSATAGFCVSDIHEVVTRQESSHIEVFVPPHARVGETLQVTLLYWNRHVTQVKAQLQVYKGLCTKVRPNHWSTPKDFNASANHQVALTWPVVPLTPRRQTVRFWVEATDIMSNFKETKTFIVQKSFVVEVAGVHRKFEQTFQLGTVMTPRPRGNPENPCFDVLQEVTTPYNKRSKKQSMTLRARVPSNALYESGRIEISITGEPLGHIVLDLPAKGISQLVGYHPMGCGEQSMMRIGPLVYATLYLKQINHASHETTVVDTIRKGIRYMNKFRITQGTTIAYSTWPGKAPSTWLTAYVAKVFSQATLVTQIEGTLPGAVCQVAMFVAGRQDATGCFSDPLGIVMDASIAGGVDSTTSMTAYITVALLEVQNNLHKISPSSCSELDHVIVNAVDYLVTQADHTNDTYTLSMIAYALTLSRTQRAKGEQLVSALLATAEVNRDKSWKHWIIPRRSLTRTQRVRLIRDPVLSIEVETAAYTLLSLLELNLLKEATDVAMWLTSQHRSNGRFISTQDTVIGLQALTLYRSKVYSTDLSQHVKVQQIRPLSAKAEELHLTNNIRNLRYTYTYSLAQGTQRDVQVQLTGVGEVRVEATCTYNTLLQKADTCPFNLTITLWGSHEVSAGRPCYNYMEHHSSACIETCYRYANSPGTNMAILYIKLHYLHKPNMENLKHIIREDANVAHVETSEQAVIFYLTHIPREEHCVEFVVTPSAPLPLNTMPVLVHLYDYHDPERLQCERFYQPNSKLYSNNDMPIAYTYIKANNEFVCGEAPEPPVHDYMEGMTPFDSSSLEDLLCSTKSPANVYALNVTFLLNNNDKFFEEHDPTTQHNTYFLDAKVNKVLKSGSLPATMHGDIRFYVQRSWLQLQTWLAEHQKHPHIVIAADYEKHGAQPLLHLDKGDVYIQRLAPHKPWVTRQTRHAWKALPQKTRNIARLNLRYLRKFTTCKV